MEIFLYRFGIHEITKLTTSDAGIGDKLLHRKPFFCPGKQVFAKETFFSMEIVLYRGLLTAYIYFVAA
jgi:hypothetical protein